jgi:hypothetical protein
MKRANIVLDKHSTGMTIIEKMDFDKVNAVQDALLFAFHPEELGEEDQLDSRYLALWNIFLASVGWTEDEFWEEFKARPNHCPDCGKLTDADGDHLDEEDEHSLKEDKTPPNLKSN